MTTARSRKSRGLAVCLVLLMAGALVFAGYFGKQWYDQKDQVEMHDLDGNVVQFDDGDIPDESELKQMSVEDEVEDPTSDDAETDDGNGDQQRSGSGGSVSDDGASSGESGQGQSVSKPLRLQVPSVGLDVGVGRLSSVDGAIRPPDFTRAFLVRNIGEDLTHQKDGTVYVTMHSIHAGTAPGNRLINIGQGTVTVQKGAKVTLGSNTYKVTGSERVSKGSLSQHKKVWANEPNRLVLITCLQRSQGKSLDNVVVYAEQV